MTFPSKPSKFRIELSFAVKEQQNLFRFVSVFKSFKNLNCHPHFLCSMNEPGSYGTSFTNAYYQTADYLMRTRRNSDALRHRPRRL